MTTRYTHVRTYVNGVRRENGQRRHCILTSCGSDATVQGVRSSGGFRMEVALCPRHAQEGGMTT